MYPRKDNAIRSDPDIIADYYFLRDMAAIHVIVVACPDHGVVPDHDVVSNQDGAAIVCVDGDIPVQREIIPECDMPAVVA